MNTATVLIGLGTGAIVLAARVHPEVFHAHLDEHGKTSKRYDVILSLGACAALLTFWSSDWPEFFAFLEKNPWSLVPLAFFLWWVIMLGARRMLHWALLSLFVTSIYHIGASFYSACTGLNRSDCPFESQKTNFTVDQKHVLMLRQGIVVYEPIAYSPAETTVTLNARDTLLMTNSRLQGSDIFWSAAFTGFRYEDKSHDGYALVDFRRAPGVDSICIHILATRDRAYAKEWLKNLRREIHDPAVMQAGDKTPMSAITMSDVGSVVVTATSEGSRHVVFAGTLAGMTTDFIPADTDHSCFLAMTPMKTVRVCPDDGGKDEMGSTPELWFRSLDGKSRKILVRAYPKSPADSS